MGILRQNTFRELGYNTGDVVPVRTYNAPTRNAVSTTSTGYEVQNGLFEIWVDFEKITEFIEKPRYRMYTRLEPGADEEVFASIYNDEGSESIVEISTSSTTNVVTSNWVSYDPETPGFQGRLVGRVKTDPGANTSKIYQLTFEVGAEL